MACVDSIWSTVEASLMNISNAIILKLLFYIFFPSFLYFCIYTSMYSYETSYTYSNKVPNFLYYRLSQQTRCLNNRGYLKRALDYVTHVYSWCIIHPTIPFESLRGLKRHKIDKNAYVIIPSYKKYWALFFSESLSCFPTPFYF